MLSGRTRKSAAKLVHVPALLGGAGLIALMLHSTIHVTLRNVADFTPSGTLHYVESWYMPIIVFLGLFATQRNDAHIEARLLYDKLPPSLQREYRIAGNFLTGSLFLAFAWFGYEQAHADMVIGLSAGATQVVVWPTKFLVPIGFGLAFLQVVAMTLKDFQIRRSLKSAEKDGSRLSNRRDVH